MTPDPGTALVPTDAPAVSLGVIHSTSPKGLVAAATEAADALAAVIAQKGLFNTIQGRKHVRVEGWTTLAAMLGCLPREAAIVRRDDGTYEADRKSTRLNSSHMSISYAVFCLKKKNNTNRIGRVTPLWHVRTTSGNTVLASS